LACVTLALEHPAEAGEFRVFNQFTESFSVRQMAELVQGCSPRPVQIAHGLENPRVEREEHYFNAANTKLLDLGLEPQLLTEDVIAGMLALVERHKGRADVNAVAPTVQWRARASSLKTATAGTDASFLVV
jgi:UDP-sulfoquinovose synthase